MFDIQGLVFGIHIYYNLERQKVMNAETRNFIPRLKGILSSIWHSTIINNHKFIIPREQIQNAAEFKLTLK